MALATVSSTLSSLMGALPQSTPREPSPVRDERAPGTTPRDEREADAPRDQAALLLARATALGALTYGRRAMAEPAPQAEPTRPPLGVRGAMLDVRA